MYALVCIAKLPSDDTTTGSNWQGSQSQQKRLQIFLLFLGSLAKKACWRLVYISCTMSFRVLNSLLMLSNYVLPCKPNQFYCSIRRRSQDCNKIHCLFSLFAGLKRRRDLYRMSCFSVGFQNCVLILVSYQQSGKLGSRNTQVIRQLPEAVII